MSGGSFFGAFQDGKNLKEALPMRLKQGLLYHISII